MASATIAGSDLPTTIVEPSMQTHTIPDVNDAMKAALAAIAAPGSFFTGPERIALAESARAARGLGESSTEMPPVIAEAVTRVATDAKSSRQDHVKAWEQDGRDVLAYIELVSVVAQISGMDSYRFALGQELEQLPAPLPGDPVPVVHPDAVTSNAWVPTVGIALAPTAISALPNETAAKKAIATAWYIPDDMVHKYGEEPGLELTRPQMEIVAARTSWLNECFF